MFKVKVKSSTIILESCTHTYTLDVYQAYSFLEELVNATSLAIQNKIKEN